MKKWLIVCFGVGLLATALNAQPASSWKLEGETSKQLLTHGAWKVEKNVQSGSGSCTLTLVFFDASRCSMRVIDQPVETNATSLKQAVAGTDAIAGCNGGYFTPEFKPLGLVVASGGRAGKFEKSSLLGGLIQVRRNRPIMLWRDEFVEVPGITDLVQAGPRLVNGGMPVKGLESVRSRPRTFLLTDNNGQWAMGISSSVTLRELSDLLAAKGVIWEFDVERALNLDGGSSTGLWWKDAEGRTGYEREFSTVRNFIVVVPRN